MRTLSGKRVLITGGASGIGKSIARRFAADGAQLILVDLNEPLLGETARELGAGSRPIATYRVDVTDVPGISALRDRINADGGPIDVLVNNAGLVFGGPFLELPLEKHFTTYRVNTLGPVAFTHAFLADLIGRPDAHLVNVASASGFIGLPYGSTYASSKWAVIGFSESIELELKMLGHDHVHVTTVCPSYVSTGLFDGAKPPMLTTMLTPDRLADKVAAAVLGNKSHVLAPWLVKLTPPLKGLLPAGLFNSVSSLLGATSSMTHWKGRG